MWRQWRRRHSLLSRATWITEARDLERGRRRTRGREDAGGACAMFLKVIFSKSKLVILLQAFLLLRGHNHQPIRGRFGVSPRLLGLRESVAKQTHTCKYDSSTQGKRSHPHLQCAPRHQSHMQTRSHHQKKTTTTTTTANQYGGRVFTLCDAISKWQAVKTAGRTWKCARTASSCVMGWRGDAMTLAPAAALRSALHGSSIWSSKITARHIKEWLGSQTWQPY